MPKIAKTVRNHPTHNTETPQISNIPRNAPQQSLKTVNSMPIAAHPQSALRPLLHHDGHKLPPGEVRECPQILPINPNVQSVRSQSLLGRMLNIVRATVI
jgi:hypothetical protein